MGILGSLGSVVGTFTGQPWMGAVGSGLDSLMSQNRAESDQQKTNEWNAQEAQKNRDFQQEMRATQYQTTVKDLQAAGLNPMLAYTNGGAGNIGGSTPPAMQSKVQAGMSSASQSANTTQALQTAALNQAQIDQVKAGTDKIRSETIDNAVNTAIAKAQLDNIQANTENTDQGTTNKKAEWKGIVADSGSKYELWDQRLKHGAFSAKAGQEVTEADTAATSNKLLKTEIPAAKAEEQFWNASGTLSPWLKTIMMMMQAGHSAKQLGGK